MEETYSFGYWVRRRRKALDLTQEALAEQIGCTRSAIKKIEADERRPSEQMAERLAECLRVPDEERRAFVQSALGVRSISRLPVAAQPLHTPTLPPTNLVAPLAPFVGRITEVSSLQAMLAQPSGRLLTLLGPPGVGKTRLAIKVAETMLSRFRDGVWLLDFAPVFDPALALETLAHEMGIPLADATPVIDQIKARLRDRRVLLLLDNFEHVMGAAVMIADLLASCPGLYCIVTSRVPLRLRGERQFPVAPLELPDEHSSSQPLGTDMLLDYPAIALFVERARAALPGFALTDVNAAAVVAICRSLDGLPLAIELVASHIKVLSPQALLARLQGPWVLSLEGAQDAPRHQQTLRSTIEWSYGRLTPSEQALFRQMAAFSGGCTLSSAERMWSRYADERTFNPSVDAVNDRDMLLPPDSFLELAISLVDKNLIRVEPGQAEQDEARFFMLDLVRSYALEQLGAHHEVESAHRRHAVEFRRLVAEAEREVHSSRQVFWWKVFSADLHNLRASLEWALEMGDLEMAAEMCVGLRHFWVTQNYLQEGWFWIERALKALEATEQRLAPLLVARLNNAAGSVAFYRNDHLTAQSLFRSALFEAELAGDKGIMAYALDGLAVVAASQSHQQESRALSEQSLDLSRQTGDHWLSAITLINLGEIARLSGQSEEAESFYEESLALMREVGDASFVAVALHNLGQVALDRGDPAGASVFLHESLDLSISAGDFRIVAANLERLAQVAYESDANLRAARLLGAAEGLRQTYSIPVQTLDREDTQRLMSAVQERTGSASYAHALSEGAALPLPDTWRLAFDK